MAWPYRALVLSVVLAGTSYATAVYSGDLRLIRE